MNMKFLLSLAERGLLPDCLIAAGIRALLRRRLRSLYVGGIQAAGEREAALVASLKKSPIAVQTEAANEQHYEVPADFFLSALGRNLKYSSCFYKSASAPLEDAEEAMLSLCVERAEVKDGMRILELGCGWGSMTLFLARRFRSSEIVGVSNSASQREFILAKARTEGLSNVKILTADMNTFDTELRFDRVVSIEMFEHMRNYEKLMAKIGSWLNPGGKLFVHIFSHRQWSYLFETDGAANWMGRYFFTGGIMPSDSLLLNFQQDMCVERHWRVSGRHYERTSRDWVRNMYSSRKEIMPVLARTYGADQAVIWFNRWKMFFMACAELFGFSGGDEWLVSHYLFGKR